MDPLSSKIAEFFLALYIVLPGQQRSPPGLPDVHVEPDGHVLVPGVQGKLEVVPSEQRAAWESRPR